MNLYHGTISVFNDIRLTNSEGKKDFGPGFYLTDDIKQATGIAARLHERGMISGMYSQRLIYYFDINLEIMRRQLNVKEFKESNEEWLDLVVAFRSGLQPSKADVIVGPTADNRTWSILNRECFPYFDNSLNKFYRTKKEKKIIVDKLKPYVYGTQYCFKNEKAFRWLKNFFIERRAV